MNEKSIILSIIIPVYNASKYLKRCLDSIFNQNTDGIEVILVNDGSTDDSGDICDAYQRQYPEQCEVFHQENKGTSTSRNFGLVNAKGVFIWFVDADDFIEECCLDSIINEIKKNKSEVFGFDYMHAGHREHDVFESQIVNGVTFVQNNSRLYLWNHIYRKSSVGDIRFLEGTKNIEDWLFNLQVLINVSTIMHVPVIGYHYCDDNQLSTSRNRSKQNLEKLSQDSFAVHMSLLEYAKSLNSQIKKDVLYKSLNFSVIGHMFSLFKFYNIQDYKNAVDIYRNLGLFPMKSSKNMKANLFRRLANMPKIVCVVMKISRILY